MKLNIPSPLEKLESDFLREHNIELWIKRDDLIHPDISGNKWRKLELNILKAQEKSLPILTFGGAYSNHILATAAACYEKRVPAIGLIRGEEHDGTNPTLSKAIELGMNLHYISRDDYRLKADEQYVQSLIQTHGRFQLVPEGGANYYGMMGCTNILSECNIDFDAVCCAGGTGTTAAGMLLKLKGDQKLELFPALKGGGFLKENIQHLLKYALFEEEAISETIENLSIISDYHFGGYAKINDDLVAFVNSFYDTYSIPLDLVYTGKMLFGIMDRISRGAYSKGSKILVLHSGGLQGNSGMEERFQVSLKY